MGHPVPSPSIPLGLFLLFSSFVLVVFIDYALGAACPVA